MRQPKKLLVNLDMGELDTSLMKYAAYLCEVMPIEHLVLIHNMRIEEPPDELKSLYPLMEVPVEQVVEQKIEDGIHLFVRKSGLEIEVNIFQNESITEVVKWVKQNDVDLSLVGKKPVSEGQGFYSRQFLRLTSHPVILLPATAKPMISNILAAIDFSKNTVNVIRTAHQLSVSLKAKLSYLHLYTLPPTEYPYVARNEKKYHEAFLQYSRSEFDQWKEKSIKSEKTANCEFRLAERRNLAQEIYQSAQEKQADLIICGAKGDTDAALPLLGIVSEKLMITNDQLPLLIVKRKEHYHWLESLPGFR